MICSACGTQILAGSRFCSHCGHAVTSETFAASSARLVRQRQGRMIAGVCAGFALHYGWDPIVVRLVLVLAVFLSVGMPVLAYFVAWIIMPNAPYALSPQTGVTAS